MIISPFKPSDLDEIDMNPGAASWRTYGTPEYAALLAKHIAVTARDAGRVLACAGVVSLDRDVGEAWSFVARGQSMLRFRHHALRLFEACGKSRIFASSETDFAQGCRWLELLGFTRLELVPKGGRDGRDHWLYLRVS